MVVQRFSSRRQRLDRSFLVERLRGAQQYDRIAGYFSSSLLEIAGEELEWISGLVRMVCNSDLDPRDVQTARAAKLAVWQSWTRSQPEALLTAGDDAQVRDRFARLHRLLHTGKLQVRVLPDAAFGLVHGKAGVITRADGSRTSFLGSANESKRGWRLNYELIWEDASPDAVTWVQEEFDALWGSPFAVPLADAVIQDVQRLASRRMLWSVPDWAGEIDDDGIPDPASAVIEAPVYRREVGLWAHQKAFVKLAFDAHRGPVGKARLVLADQVGLGKTLQLAMAAQLMALTGDKPILVICPKPLLWQWQDELRDLLDMPAAVWDGRRWVDEHGVEYPAVGPEGIRKCPRRVGIVSSGLITRQSAAAEHLLKMAYDCVILDEAHHARRRNLGEQRDHEAPDPNNLLRFMWRLAERTRSLLLATATPVQVRPIEAWDLLDILSRGDETVFGNLYSRWRHGAEALQLVMQRQPLPQSEQEQWDWIRNPLPPSAEHRDFTVLRRDLRLDETQAVAPGGDLIELSLPARRRLADLYPRLMYDHNPFIRRIVRRTRTQLESQIDAETGEPLLRRIHVTLLGEDARDALVLPPYLHEAYELAEEFCAELGKRGQHSGFLRTLLLRRMGSSISAGLITARRMLGSWAEVLQEAEGTEDSSEGDAEEDVEEDDAQGITPVVTQAGDNDRALTQRERQLLERLVAALARNQDRDPKVGVVLECLRSRGWLDLGCIVFSQYRDSVEWLAEQLTQEFPEEVIGLYSGPRASGLMHGGQWTPVTRETIKEMVRRGDLRLLLGTDAASEGLNLQRLATLINLDLPWNPTRLEQRKGRIQRIGQVHDTVQVYNLRYQDSVEDRVHELLSDRLESIYHLFGQVPDVLETAWVKVAEGERAEAKRIIDAIPASHPFDLRYTQVAAVDWESCRSVLEAGERRRMLQKGW